MFNGNTVIVMQNQNYWYFNVLTGVASWDIIRLIWIAFYKNSKNKKCHIGRLSNDIVKYIITFLPLARAESNEKSNNYDNDYQHCVDVGPNTISL